MSHPTKTPLGESLTFYSVNPRGIVIGIGFHIFPRCRVRQIERAIDRYIDGMHKVSGINVEDIWERKHAK